MTTMLDTRQETITPDGFATIDRAEVTHHLDQKPWLSLRGLARVLSISTGNAAVIARTGKVSSRKFPGMTRQYNRDDALRLLAECSTPAARVATLPPAATPAV